MLNGKTSALLFTLFRDTPVTGDAALASMQAIGARVIVRAVLIAHTWRSQVLKKSGVTDG